MLDVLAGFVLFLLIVGFLAAGLADAFGKKPETSEQWLERLRPKTPDLPTWEPNPPKYHCVAPDQHSR